MPNIHIINLSSYMYINAYMLWGRVCVWTNMHIIYIYIYIYIHIYIYIYIYHSIHILYDNLYMYNP